MATYGQIDLCGFPKAAALWYRHNWLVHPNATEAEAADAHRDIAGKLAASAPPHRPAASLTLGVDVPSKSTCTGDKVVMDGRDVALLRVSALDAAGALVGVAGDVNVTITVVSGPGRVIGVGNGDAASHQRPKGSVIQTHGGLARVIVQVTIDCTTAGRAVSRAVDAEAGGTAILDDCPLPLPAIVVHVTATRRTQPLLLAAVTIALSADAADDALAVARRGQPCDFDYIDTFPM